MENENKYLKSLVKNARGGKLVALEELFEINLNQAYTLLLRLTRDKQKANLLTQKTLVTAWQEIKGNGPDDISFLEWLKNIAIKIAVTELNNSSKKKKRKKAKKNQPEQSSAKSIEHAIANLDDEPRFILVLNKIENRSFANISRFLNKPESEIDNLLTDAIDQISSSLENDGSSKDSDGMASAIRKEFEADIKVLQSALDEIMEIRIEEVKESDSEIEARELEEYKQYEQKKKEERKKKLIAKQEIDNEKPYRREFGFNKKIILSFGLPLLVAGFFIYSFTSKDSWEVYSTRGAPYINKEPFSDSRTFNPGDQITVDEASNAIIKIPEIGKIKVFSGTSVTRLENDNSCKLLSGKLAVNALTARENLIMFVPEAKIQVFQPGVDYSVQVDKRGNSVIELEAGWLIVSSGNNVTILPKNYSLKILHGGGVSMPYYSYSKSKLDKLLDEYLFNGKRGLTLNRILDLSTRRESITLWNLLQRVKPKHRSAVYEKLYQFVPHPDFVTRNDVLELGQNQLKVWLEEIEWSL